MKRVGEGGGEILAAVGHEMLVRVLEDPVELLDAAVTVYDVRGTPVFRLYARPASWCGLLSAASVALAARLARGDDALGGPCHEACWEGAACPAIDRGGALDASCAGGRTIHAVPIRVGEETVGVIAFGYGAPPTDPERQRAVAARWEVPVEELERRGAAHRRRDPGVVEAAKRGVATAAGLFGEMVLRRRRQLEQERQQQLVVGMVGHDLRNPLNAIALGSGALSRDDHLAPRSALAAETLVRAARRMSRLVDQLLDVAASRAGGLPVVLAPLDLDVLAREVVDEVRAANPAASIDLSSAGSCPLRGDRDRLAQLLANLVDNAVGHGEPGSPIGVRVGTAGDTARVVVHNEGPPIPPELVPFLFDPFRRGANPRRPGMGLGLHICWQVVNAHHGTIAVTSSAAAGTSFEVGLPLG